MNDIINIKGIKIDLNLVKPPEIQAYLYCDTFNSVDLQLLRNTNFSRGTEDLIEKSLCIKCKFRIDKELGTQCGQTKLSYTNRGET